MSQTFLKIKSQYIMKEIFSFLDYNYSLKLIKNNKEIQKRLEIGIQNYKERTSYQLFERKEIINRIPELNGILVEYHIRSLAEIFTVIFFIYAAICALILNSIGTFNEKNTKNNFNKNYLKIINKINLSLFGFLPFFLISYLIIFVWATRDYYSDNCKIKWTKMILMVLIIFIFFCYDIFIIIKLILSYRIKKDKITWFMRLDNSLIYLIAYYLYLSTKATYKYCKYAGKRGIKPKKIILKKFRDIKIDESELPDNFDKMSDYEKRKYFLNRKNFYKISISAEQKKIINEINKFRKENNIDKLNYDKVIYFKDLLIDKYSELFLYDHENIFKISNNNYVLKYSISEFKDIFNNKEKNLTEILLNDHLKKIIIIEKNDFYLIILKGIYYDNSFNSVNIINEDSEYRSFALGDNETTYICEVK